MLELAAQIPNLEVEERVVTLHEVVITIIRTNVAIVIITINNATVIMSVTIKMVPIDRFWRRMGKGSWSRCSAPAPLPPSPKLAI